MIFVRLFSNKEKRSSGLFFRQKSSETLVSKISSFSANKQKNLPHFRRFDTTINFFGGGFKILTGGPGRERLPPDDLEDFFPEKVFFGVLRISFPLIRIILCSFFFDSSSSLQCFNFEDKPEDNFSFSNSCF